MISREKVLIFGLDSPIGLTASRELFEYGIEVFAIARNCHSFGFYSKSVSRCYILDTTKESIEFVNYIAFVHDIPYLIVLSESDINYFNQNRHRLSSIRALIPDKECMTEVLNKDRVYQIANDIGIITPTTYKVGNMQQLEKILPELNYPVVLKWSNPTDVAEILRKQRLSLEKCRYCYSGEQLQITLRQYESTGCYPMIQSFAPGHGLGQMLFIHQGEPLLKFQHERIHEWPPEGGVSTLCRSLPEDYHLELMEKSVELLCRIKWEGPAMVEYRYCPNSGLATLMEINGRFWGSLPLAYRAGAPFVWYTYIVLGKGEVPVLQKYKKRLRCLFFIPEVKRIFRVVFQPNLIENRSIRFNKYLEIISFFACLIDPTLTHYVFKWSDPLPAFADIFYSIGRFLKKDTK